MMFREFRWVEQWVKFDLNRSPPNFSPAVKVVFRARAQRSRLRMAIPHPVGFSSKLLR